MGPAPKVLFELQAKAKTREHFGRVKKLGSGRKGSARETGPHPRSSSDDCASVGVMHET